MEQRDPRRRPAASWLGVMLGSIATAGCSLIAASPSLTSVQSNRPDSFRAIYTEMVEIDSSFASGSCTKVVRAAEARLVAAGYRPGEYEIIVPDGHPKDGNIVVRISGKESTHKGVLLVAHVDVVNARREDWTRDPYKLVEENGFFYGRGSYDDKSLAATFLDLMIRLKQDGFRPSRDLKMALTCGEEGGGFVDGVEYLLSHRRDLLDADFALNEGGGGMLSAEGKPLWLTIKVGEKIHQVVTLEVTNPGGHSSRPVQDNAIYRLAQALRKIESHQFPVELSPGMRRNFEVRGPLTGGELGQAMTALARDPTDRKAIEAITNDPDTNIQIRTTCVATQLDAGHAANALPQRAKAVISCRTMQSLSASSLIEQLNAVIGDPEVHVTIQNMRAGSQAVELTPEIVGPIEAQAAKFWPGTPVIAGYTPGASDARFLISAGIPTYGLKPFFGLPNENALHGLNENIRVNSLYEGRAFLEAVIRDYLR